MSKGSRWKPLAVLAATLVVIVGVSYLFISKAHERKEFVSQVDPQSGYRCRFTLSADWQKGSIFAGGPGSALLYVDSFSPAPPNPIMAWIDAHFFDQTETSVFPPSISLICPNMQVTRSIFQVQAGYPELLHPKGNTRRHLRIDDFPASVFTSDDKTYSGTMLIVYVPDHSLAYVLNGGTDNQNATPVNREMQAIISSFHVEKVTAPTGGEK